MPTPVTYSTNGMPTFKGQAPGLDTNGVISNIAYYHRMVAKTAAYTVLRTESGTVFHTTGATQAITFTLPAINTGPWIFEFINGADQSMTVASGTADTIVTYNDLAADSVAFSTSSEKIGGYIRAETDGTTLFVIAHGASQAQHITIAT